MATNFITTIGSGITSVLSWFGDVITSFTSADGALAPLLPFFGIAIAISLVLLVVKVIKRVAWGA